MTFLRSRPIDTSRLRQESAAALKDQWQANWKAGLEYADEDACRNRSDRRRAQGLDAIGKILDAINAVREDVLQVLQSLD